MKQQMAKLNYLHIAPRKVKLLADILKGLPVGEAEARLLLQSQRASGPLLKLLRSAVANAKNNQKLSGEKLFISGIRVDQGPMLKRVLPRAQGRATPIHKKMSHVTLIIEERPQAAPPRFTIIPPPKKKKKAPKESRVKKPKPTVASEEKPKPKEKVGFFKKIFRRKTV